MKKHYLIQIGERLQAEPTKLGVYSSSIFGSFEDARIHVSEQLDFLISHNELYEIPVVEYSSMISVIDSISYQWQGIFNSEGGVISECNC